MCKTELEHQLGSRKRNITSIHFSPRISSDRYLHNYQLRSQKNILLLIILSATALLKQTLQI